MVEHWCGVSPHLCEVFMVRFVRSFLDDGGSTAAGCSGLQSPERPTGGDSVSLEDSVELTWWK